jgi:hypothetical protein
VNKQVSEVGLFSVLKSAFSGLLGVQSNANRERDFQSGKFWHFFIAGIIVTLLFLGSVYFAVNLLILSTT